MNYPVFFHIVSICNPNFWTQVYNQVPVLTLLTNCGDLIEQNLLGSLFSHLDNIKYIFVLFSQFEIFKNKDLVGVTQFLSLLANILQSRGR